MQFIVKPKFNVRACENFGAETGGSVCQCRCRE